MRAYLSDHWPPLLVGLAFLSLFILPPFGCMSTDHDRKVEVMLKHQVCADWLLKPGQQCGNDQTLEVVGTVSPIAVCRCPKGKR